MSKTPSLNLQSLLSGGENKHIPATVSVIHKGALSSRRRENRQGFTRRYPGVNFFKCLQRRGEGGKEHSGQLRKPETVQHVPQGTYKSISTTEGKAQHKKGQEMGQKS